MSKDNVVIYSKDNCVWCDRAKELLKTNNYSYTELKYGVDYTKDDLVKKLNRSDRITTPQIFIDGELIGGYNELKNMFDVIDFTTLIMKKQK